MARILIIEDDDDTRAALATALGRAQHEVETAADGREGLERHAASRPELIVLDIFMPEMDGLETIQNLRRTDPRVKILIISAAPESSYALKAARLIGANRTLRKPFAFEEFLAAVKETLVLQ